MRSRLFIISFFSIFLFTAVHAEEIASVHTFELPQNAGRLIFKAPDAWQSQVQFSEGYPLNITFFPAEGDAFVVDITPYLGIVPTLPVLQKKI